MMVFGLIPLSVTNVFADDSATQYKELKAGEYQWATIENGGDTYWFVIKPDKDAFYALYTDGMFNDTFCELYDSEKKPIWGCYEESTPYGGYRVEAELKSGETYYLAVYYDDENQTGDIYVGDDILTPAESIVLTQGEEITVNVDTTVSLSYEFTPENHINVPYSSLKWSCSDESVAELFGDGNLKIKSAGEVVVTVETESGLTDSIKVKAVEKEALSPGDQKQGKITYPYAKVIYKITPEKDCRYLIKASSKYDMNMRFYQKPSNMTVDSGLNPSISKDLTGGETYYLEIQFRSGLTGPFTVSVEEMTRVKSVKITSPPTQTTYVKGFLPRDSFNCDGIEADITWADDTVSHWKYGDGNYINGEYISAFTWKKGEENIINVTCGGQYDSFYVNVIDDPVESIEVVKGLDEPITEFTHGSWSGQSYNPDTDMYEYEYYWYSIRDTDLKDVELKINYKDGTSKTAKYSDKVDFYGFSYKNNGQNDKHWTVGSDNDITISYLGHTTPLKVTIVESPIDHIEVTEKPAPIERYTHGFWDEESDFFGDYGEYYRYDENNFKGIPVRIYYKDGTTVDTVTGEELNGYKVEYYTLQSLWEPFDIGNKNKIYINYMGHLTETNAEIVENTHNKIGDINKDSNIDVLDALIIHKYAIDKITLNDEEKYLADVNDDGTVDILDSVDIQKYAVDKLKEFNKKIA
jgi:hypothetical protein